MQNDKIGNIIRNLRAEHNMTQKQLADKMNISDKTVSKWERGLGCPDISLISELSDLLEIDIQKLLSGNIIQNDFVEGNMKNTKYYVCPVCCNISFCTGKAEVLCCGKKLSVQALKKASEEEKLSVEIIEDEWYISSEHEMTKENYISFVAFVTGDSIKIIKQYPEWNMNVRIQKRGHGMLIWYDIKKGLFYQLL
jgi:Predicted transcriptional regulators